MAKIVKDERMEKLVEMVKEHSGMTKAEIKDVVGVGRGADAGYSGFTYYDDTTEFYDNNEELIWELLEEMADQMGQKPLELVASFGCADSITDVKSFKNALAWFVLEETSRYLQGER